MTVCANSSGAGYGHHACASSPDAGDSAGIEAIEPWLDGEAVRLGPAPEDLLVTHRVRRRVNNPRDDDPECVIALAAA